MSTLRKVLTTLSQSESRLFSGQYSLITDQLKDFYEPETDEFTEGITGMDGNTQQVFTLHIAAKRVHGRLVDIYLVQASYFRQMKTEAIVSGPKLMDFLLQARIVVSDGNMNFLYSNT